MHITKSAVVEVGPQNFFSLLSFVYGKHFLKQIFFEIPTCLLSGAICLLLLQIVVYMPRAIFIFDFLCSNESSNP